MEKKKKKKAPKGKQMPHAEFKKNVTHQKDERSLEFVSN